MAESVPTKQRTAEPALAHELPVAAAQPAKAVDGASKQPHAAGRQWRVVCPEGVVVRKGQRVTSLKVLERLPCEAVVEEVELVGGRLHFVNDSGNGPQKGWVSTADKGGDLMVPLADLSDPATSFDGMKRGFLSDAKADLYPEGSPEGEPDRPLEGWASLSQLFSGEVAQQAGPAVAAETLGRRRRRKEELPPVEDLQYFDESSLMDLLGMDARTARDFAALSPAQKRKLIAEARALLELSPQKRREALDNYRTAWPKGPFPELTPPVEEPELLPPGSCFPYSRHLREVSAGPTPEWGLESPAGRAVRTFFARRAMAPPEAQKEFLRSLRCEVPCVAAATPPDAGAGRQDTCRVGGTVDKGQLAGSVMAKGPAQPDDLLRYLNAELQERVCLLDGSMVARLQQEGLEEADYRGERFRNFKEVDVAGKPVSLKGNTGLLVLTKASLVAEIHKEFLLAGADIIRTNTYGCNAQVQQQYKTSKLVYEMNKAAAQLAKKATAEVTRQEPAKPRFVAGVIGPGSRLMSLDPSARWNDMVEAYSEQIKGLVEGGADMLMLDSVGDSLNAKAAIFAIDEHFERAGRRRPPLLLSAQIAEEGRTASGQSAEAFYVSVKHARPLAVGLGCRLGPGQAGQGYRALTGLSAAWCLACPGAEGQSPEEFAAHFLEEAREGGLNFVGGGAGTLPSHVAAAAARAKEAGPRGLPSLPEAPSLQLSGLDACLAKPGEGFQVVGAQCTVMGSASFKKKIGAYKATSKRTYLQEALELCVRQCEGKPDILDFNLDSDLASGPARPARGVMGAFMEMAAAEPRVAKVPFMLCSCEWETIKEGLQRVQGKCAVNGITLILGEEEFLRVAKECQRFGAAIVVLAVTEDGEPAESFEDKVRILQRSYRLLRSKLDFAPEDIILDCQVLLLGLPEFPNRAVDFMNAVAELKRTCPGASFVGGVNNLSLPFRGLSVLRDALHSIFLYHAIPKGLNLAIAWPGALPAYGDIDAETRALCEELVLNSSVDGRHLERFLAFVSFRSGGATCLPAQSPGLEDEECRRRKAPAVLKEAREAQGALLRQRVASSPEEQKAFLRSLRCSVACGAEAVAPEQGAARQEAARLQGPVAGDRLAGRVLARAAAEPEDVARYLNAELRRRVCIFATPAQDEALPESGYKEYFGAGADVCGTNTLGATSYEESRAAAQLAKAAAAEATRGDAERPRFVAGVIGPTAHALSSPGSGCTWDELVGLYTGQIRGLVDGGVDLLAVEMVSDTLNAKAAIFAVDEHFEQAGRQRPPLLISAAAAADGRTPSGQSIEAFCISVKHARPLSVGITGGLGSGQARRLCKALAELNLGWCHACAGAGGEGAEACAAVATELASERLVNFVGTCGASPAHVAAMVAKVQGAAPRPLPALPGRPALQLAGLEAHHVRPDGGCQLVGQRCNMTGSARFKGLVDAYKYTRGAAGWEAALELCAEQCARGADLLDLNFDSELLDARWAMGKFVRLCGATPEVAKVPLVLSSASWPVIEEGLRSAQGRCVVNALSLAQGEEEFLRLGKACLRYGAAVVVMTAGAAEECPSFQERVQIGTRAYSLLRMKLDFPAEDIILDCSVRPVGSGASAKDFIDAMAELKRCCPGVSFMGGVGSLSLPYRGVAPLREALHSVFLYHAIPMGLNMAIVEPGALPCYSGLEAQTKRLCEDALLNESADASHVERLGSFAAYLSGGAAEELPVTLAPEYELPLAIQPAMRLTPGFRQPLSTLVQGTGTINASLFQTFGSKCHTATIFHKTVAATAIKRAVWFSSISVWMGQGGSGPVTGASSLMDGLALYQRWMQYGHVGVAVEWGAIGEIGLRRTVYGSRDVFAQFDLGQKLIGPAETQFLMRAVCTGGPDPYDVIGLAYLDQTWQMTLAGVTASGGLERKNFTDM